MARAVFAGLGILLALFFGSIAVTGFLLQTRPVITNVVVITADTLRADHVSSYGYFAPTTPNIDRFAEEGILFTNAFSQIPHTPPSHWSIFTGLYPFRHGMFTPKDNGSGLQTLPGILKEKGYVTAGFVSSQMLNGFAGEFDYFNSEEGKERVKTRQQAADTTEKALSWLRKHWKKKFFLWIHYFDPHSPYNPPEGYDIFNYSTGTHYTDARYSMTGLSKQRTIREDIGRYDGEIRYMDENIGKVLGTLKELGADGNTVVLIVSDHGECFGEHNFSDFGYDKKGPCVFHGKTLYDEEVHVPLILRIPSFPKGLRIEETVETVDVFPTLLEILGIKAPENNGKRLVPLIEGGKGKGYAFMQTRSRRGLPSMGIRTQEWKYVKMVPSGFDLETDMIEQEGGPAGNPEENGSLAGKVLLLNMTEGEKRNFIGAERETADMLEKKLGEIVSSGMKYRTVEIDTETEKLLKSLGYIE